MEKRFAKGLEEIATQEYEALLEEKKQDEAERQQPESHEVFKQSKKRKSRKSRR